MSPAWPPTHLLHVDILPLLAGYQTVHAVQDIGNVSVGSADRAHTEITYRQNGSKNI